MDSQSCQYDATLGGHVELPETEKVFEYAEKRLSEVATLIRTIKHPTKSKLIFQTMPRHMRRRTASQNPKRLPVRFRQGHLSQLRKSGTPTEKKRPCRKYRRRVGNLRMEYARRQKKCRWLETHIWHAKRFHMVQKWGFKIPWAPCDKSYRACYRATARHCLIQDISYLSCLEIRGRLEDLSMQLKRICNPTELSFTAKCYVSGQREGIVSIFERDKFPLGAIGQVSFFWKPPDQKASRVLWIFIHPSHLKDTVCQLEELFVPGSVQIRDLGQKINRFRLTGPLSHSVLTHALHCKENPQIDSTEFNREAHGVQMQYWTRIADLSSPAELPPGMILGLVVEDPRLNRPEKRSKAIPDVTSVQEVRIPPMINSSPLWDETLRDKLPAGIMNSEKYSERRRIEGLAPGQRCSFEEDLQAVPVLLVQRPGSLQGFASGWDVIVTEGYGVLTWISLIMWGARAGGWRESVSTLRELGRDAFAPDTPAGRREATEQAEELRTKYFRKPAKKRVNYTKLSIVSPFECPWQQLIDEWSGKSAELYVLRDRRILEQCQKVMRHQLPMEAVHLDESVLIPVCIRMVSRGNPGNCALIALPTAQELEKIHSGECGALHTEPLAKDPQQKARNKLRKNHKRFLKRQRRLRLRLKQKLQEKSVEKVKIPKERSQIVVSACYEFKRKMEDLWLPQHPTSVKDQCSRTVIGYVTQSDFSFIDSTVSAIGYITLNGLRAVIGSGQKWGRSAVLVRSTASRQYRGASISVRCQ
ncbi:ribonucleases P/MRP protein subunit POP1 [Phlebotomus argentipes]|uniref:ribonucleases P/MRP protein subunit POP1 n=1 Tax=Phlebotomus argentipes TaxID=94469 RepID=UPI0028932F87|nr:ribonucleases P/MRP protein subunit POP1 [Phlebotomus argentipes]XP_059622808.1 ribonucleases P/MRP protein subunit POP1 [Phlebotomus argentipes]